MYTPPVIPSAEVAEILTIGDELTRGEIVDTNAAWLGERLTLLGLHVRWHTSTTDDPADIAAALRSAAGRARVVVTSGGLGPTEDDRTVEVIAGLLGVAPVVEPEHRARMEARFAERGFQVTPNNLRQVRVPAGADVCPNRAGLAPGFHVSLAVAGQGGGGPPAEIYTMPGVPREMKRIYEEEVEPRLRRLRAGADAGVAVTARRVWRVAGMGESHVDHRLRGLLDGVAGATLHFRISFPENLVSVVVRRGTEAEANEVLDRLGAEVRARLGEHVYGEGDQPLAQAIGGLLRARGETVATAESCTGGLVGDLLTDVAGSSDYYRGGVVAYANALKQGLLGVGEETLREHGAVSEECVREMAAGAREAAGVSWAVAISGIAGPGGGTTEKPVGLVHFAVAGPGGHIEARKLVWPGERRMVKQLAAHAALFLLYRQLAGLPPAPLLGEEGGPTPQPAASAPAPPPTKTT